MEGFLRGKCIPRDLKVNETNAEYLVRKFAEAEAKCAALAAENAELKHAMAVTLEHVSVTDAGQAGVAAMIINDALHHSETPATDAFLAEVLAQGVKSPSNAVQSVIAERQRHQSAEGWTPEHDDQYSKSQLLWASSCYVLNAIHPFNRIPFDWPWTPEWWKPTNPRRDLVKAGALILAELERIDRAAGIGKGE
ncbi:ead/Ea22-like family protein [Escherichia coli]|nr:ead/Ea22-like family protein [Escherichia coli]EFH7725140.1 ead/Ea22-like family protein [Escherichia coli]EFH9113478.1 ead/Ea22-like family protein [Escherichia coli]EFH9309064.1 ead/Ea22-like family protein [Escherichia coli]EFO1119329.1 ead/Ea22-like family protein [Escherichia coli]